MIDIGYDDRNAFSALGTVAIIIFNYFLRLIISLILKTCLFVFDIKQKWINKLERYLSNGMYFENLFFILIEAPIEILICSFINY